MTWRIELSALRSLLVVFGLGALGLWGTGWAQEQSGGLESNLEAPGSDIILEVRGNIAKTNADGAALLDRDALGDLPRATLETRTAVTDGVRRFGGVLMRDVLALVGAQGDTVTATALNDYIIDIPMEDLERFDILLADRMDGEQLLASDKGPLWIVYPRDQHEELQDIRYDYRWVWQLYRLDVE